MESFGFYRIDVLEDCDSTKEIAKSLLPNLYRLWIVDDNIAIAGTELDEGYLNQSLCFYPKGYVPDIHCTYVRGYQLLFDEKFAKSNPRLDILQNVISSWNEPTPITRARSDWYPAFRSVSQAHAVLLDNQPDKNAAYSYQYCSLLAQYLADWLITTVPWLSGTRSISTLTREFLVLVEEQYLNRRDMTYYHRQLYVSESKLLKQCQRDLGMSPKQVYQRRLMKDAKHLLLHSNLSMSAIAEQLNFSNYNYFCERFRLATDLSPSDYRRFYKTIN